MPIAVNVDVILKYNGFQNVFEIAKLLIRNYVTGNLKVGLNLPPKVSLYFGFKPLPVKWTGLVKNLQLINQSI